MTLVWVSLLATSIGALEGESRVTSEEVLRMMAKVPAVEDERSAAHDRPGHFERLGIAGELAVAIALVAPSRTAASLMVLYAAFEGGNLRCAEGDGGKALGPYQLQGVAREVACDPVASSRAWLRLADWSWKVCTKAESPPDERLAFLASGSCDRGRKKVRARAELARLIAAVD